MQNACRLNCLLIVILILFLLFLMAQRYKFESKSQPSGLGFGFRRFGFRVLDWLPVFQSMLLLVVGNCRYLRLSCAGIAVVVQHVRKTDALHYGVHFRFVRHTLCLLSGDSGQSGSVHTRELRLQPCQDLFKDCHTVCT